MRVSDNGSNMIKGWEDGFQAPCADHTEELSVNLRAQERSELFCGVRCAWRRGSLASYFPMWRPVHAFRCHSTGIAGADEFAEHMREP